jgi:hypothetical protein
MEHGWEEAREHAAEVAAWGKAHPVGATAAVALGVAVLAAVCAATAAMLAHRR